MYLGDLSVDQATNKPFIIWTCQSLLNRNFSMQEAKSRDNSLADEEAFSFQPNKLPWDFQDENVAVALTGKAFKHVSERKEQSPFIFNSILAKAKVYARMSPDDKALLVDSLQTHLEINCGMCGDGANDCGALKTAAVGISLSEAEASIAAPFTSKVQDIRCVVQLLIEGKAALTTSFQAFKFIELYSVIQLVSCALLYSIGSNITDTQFLYIDLVALVPLSVVQAWTGSYHSLTKDVPTATLFYFPVLLSVIVSSLIQFAFQLFFFFSVRQQPFYVALDPEHLQFDKPNPSYEETVLFMVANYQYLITCMAFSIAKPFRKAIWTNGPFFVCVLFLLIFNALCIFLPSDNAVPTRFDLLPFTTEDPKVSYYSYKYWIAAGVILNSLLTYLAEKLIVNVFTKRSDARLQAKKQAAFEQKMQEYRG